MTRDGILRAIAEYDALGDEPAFLRKGGFRRSREYALVYEGKPYPSKAIVGAAHGFDRPDLGPLDWRGLSGGVGRNGAVTILQRHGFAVQRPRTSRALGSGSPSRSIADVRYVVNITRDAAANVATGAAAGVWGLPMRAAENRLNQIVPARTGREVLEELRVGDFVLAVSGGPNPRRRRWMDVDFPNGWLWRVTRTYWHDEARVWPNPNDEIYPHRFGIEEVEALTHIASSDLSPAGVQALKYSATNRGMVLPSDAFALVPRQLDRSPLMPSTDPMLSLLNGDLDSVSLAKARREQRRLRNMLIGDRPTGDCSLCGRTFPVCCLRVAHIKRRAECTAHERRQVANLMLACTLGCDHLFELGYVFVDRDGIIRRRADRGVTADLTVVIRGLEGRTCLAHGLQSEPYFAWHRTSWVT